MITQLGFGQLGVTHHQLRRPSLSVACLGPLNGMQTIAALHTCSRRVGQLRKGHAEGMGAKARSLTLLVIAAPTLRRPNVANEELPFLRFTAKSKCRFSTG